MNRPSSCSPQKELLSPSVSPKQALDQKWVIGRGWVNKADIELEEQEDAIREALKGDDQYQRERDEHE